MSLEQRGRIVVLNGPSSAGKTTLARALHAQRGPTSAAVSIDDFFRFLHPDAPNNWASYATLTDAMFATAAAFAANGFDVIVDTVFERPDCADAMRRALVSCDYHLVAVTCPLDVLDAREAARGDRRIGQARRQSEHVLQGLAYDLELDTSVLTVEDCVERVIALLRS